jgi:hypothetical protein
MDIFSLATEQGVHQTKMLISHVRKQDHIGKMIGISLDHLQLQAGVSWPVLSQLGATQRRYVDPCFLTKTWEFLDSIGTHIRFDTDEWLCPQRTGDVFIMEQLATLHRLKPADLVHAQRCRLFLGVTTLADITNTDGRSICEWALNGIDTPRQSTHIYPRQERPSSNVWKTWRDLL